MITENNNNLHSHQIALVGLLCLGATALTTEEAFAKMAVTKLPTSPINKRTIKKEPNKQMLCCEGYPVLITADSEGKTQVYVNDGTAADHPEVTMQEDYRIENSDWEHTSIFAAGGMGGSERKIEVTMTGGYVSAIYLGGAYSTDIVAGDATLTVEGGMVDYISVVGRDVETTIGNECTFSPVYGSATINLSHMTYGGPQEMGLVRYYTMMDGASEAKPNTDNITLNIDYATCVFEYPETSPIYEPDPDACQHIYEIKSIVPDDEVVDAGLVTIVCNQCGQTWKDITFSASGDSGPNAEKPSGYWYYVDLYETLEAPTCQPGRGMYILEMCFHTQYLYEYFENAIPPVEGMHQYDADGVCRQPHYMTQRDIAGRPLRDKLGNLQYQVDALGKLIKDNDEVKEIRNYWRQQKVVGELMDDNGNQLRRRNGSSMQYVDWEDIWYDDTSAEGVVAMFTEATIPSDNPRPILGILHDVVIDGTDLTMNGFYFNDNANGVVFELHDHILQAGKTDSELMEISSSRPIQFRNGTVRANVTTGSKLLLDKAKLYTKKLRVDNEVKLRDVSELHLLNSGTVEIGSIQADETSTYDLPLSFRWLGDVDGDENVTLDDAMKLAEMIIGKRTMPADHSLLDVNDDTKINVSDVIEIVNVALGRKPKNGIPVSTL